MQKKFLSGLLVLLFLNLLIKPFWILGVDRAVQNIVGAADYGVYYAIFNFSFLFNIFLDVGLTNFNNRNIAQNSHLLNKYFSGILGIKLLLSALYIIITISFGFIIGYDHSQMNLLFILAFNQVLISLVLYFRSNISGLHFFKTDSVISVLDRFLMILFCSILIWGHLFEQQITIYWFVYCQTIAYSVTAIVAFIIVVRKAKFKHIYWNTRFFYVVLKQSMPFALLVLLMTFYNRIDSVMIERLLPTEVGNYQAGIYASAYRLLDATNMIAVLFAVILLPVFARLIKLHQPVNEIVQLSFSLLFTCSLIIAFATISFRYEIMNLLYPQHINESLLQFNARMNEVSFVFGALMSCFVAISSTYIFGTLLTANGSLKMLNIVAAGGMLLNIIINLILIPKYMATGSAIASVITQFATAIIQMIIAIKIFHLKLKWNAIIRFMCFAGTLVVLIFLVNIFNFRWDIKLIIFSIASILTAFLLKIINMKNIINLFALKGIVQEK